MEQMRAVRMERPAPGAARWRDDLPVPEPGPEEVRVRVERAAICGTDRHIVHWDPSVASMMNPPLVIGHEFCGTVESLGPGVEGWHEGDYVSAEMHLVCGRCRACRAGNQHVCEHTRIAGVHRDGCFAEYVVLPAANLVRLDRDVVPPQVGAFLDALGNAVHTVQASSGVAGKHVLLSGYGAIGALAAAVVEFLGAASLTITEVQPRHLERARAWIGGLSGRTEVRLHDPTAEGDLARTIREATSGGVDVVLEMSGAPAAIDLALETLYPAGELIQLGIPSRRDLTLERFSERVIFKGLRLQGVLGRRMFSTWQEMLRLLGEGLAVEHVVSLELPMSEFSRGIELLDAGEAHKVVLDPTA